MLQGYGTGAPAGGAGAAGTGAPAVLLRTVIHRSWSSGTTVEVASISLRQAAGGWPRFDSVLHKATGRLVRV